MTSRNRHIAGSVETRAESVADRAKGLYEEHLATQRKFDTEMQRETLSENRACASTTR